MHIMRFRTKQMKSFRLTPTLALVVAFTSTWLRHLGGGPRWNHYVGREYLQCRENGWTNLLFINNLVNPGNMVSIKSVAICLTQLKSKISAALSSP